MVDRTPAPQWFEDAQRAARGDEVALQGLLAALYDKITGFLFRRFDRNPEAGDLVRDLAQETLVRIALGIGECRAASDAQVLAWVFRIARNVAIDYIRRRQQEVAVLRFQAEIEGVAISASFSEWHASPDAGSGTEQRIFEILSNLRDGLPDETVALLWHRLVEDFTWPEVADLLGTTADGAKRRFQRVQKSLRRRFLEKVDELPEPERSQVRARLTR